MFGTQYTSSSGTQSQPSTNVSTNRFANVSILSHDPVTNRQLPYQYQSQQLQQGQGQQLPQQGQQQQTLQQQQQAQHSSYTSNFAQNSNTPTWYNNPKKRVIPQNIVKRSTRGTSSSSPLRSESSDNSIRSKRSINFANSNTINKSTNVSNYNSGFNTISFGSKKGASTHNTNDQDLSLLLSDSNEAPPMVSIHDWKEDEYGSLPILPSQSASGQIFSSDAAENIPNTSMIGSNNNTSIFPVSTPLSVNNSRMFTNAFDKENALSTANTNIFASSSAAAGDVKAESNGLETSRRQDIARNDIAAIIVFGYPESISNSIITHFAHFGTILEDFDVLRSISGINLSTLRNRSKDSKYVKKYPIFTGDGWVKLTYENSSSASRALQENGTVFSGSLIGCIPYTKAAVEQLASCKISNVDDIGENNIISDSNIINKETNLTSNNNYAVNVDNINNTSFLATTPLVSSFQPSTPFKQSFDKSTVEPSVEGVDKENFHTNKPNIIPLTNQSSPLRPTAQNASQNPHRLNIKDGKSLFLHNTDTNRTTFFQRLESNMREDESKLSQMNYQNNPNKKNNNNDNKGIKQSITHSFNNWLFGWNDL
ncbi:FG-nucleoporin NUP53 NDAI_0H03110 [Naumovozyma dairenensis CBS 421]|uniref:RRM Nup35-type domain-containing protein n=1 Tax=Naumovozyma dairenensis (strain ATCC 10597 / BCRC 20456 / CBS 421 / NBRC 0211 / NRRL Y-12639) TaxID=1071378 RepID=G0WFC3_NAUDC|nr:hypothetical protein NDAI_0H03110 [Naumovozyma dairenensis CBS 421]CCD26484.1 hypothetical protein NDAI_0H03110 [Naumovozyma dairenensis CBS 421]